MNEFESMEKGFTGIILCGGKSSRIGANKALLKLGKHTLIEHVIEHLKTCCTEILISTTSRELDYLPYKKIKDEYAGIGPISGIYSTLKASQTNHNIILSCDTPFVSPEFLKFLIDKSNGYDIVLPSIHGQIQSMTGYFSKKLVPAIENEISVKHFKPIQMFMQFNLNVLHITPDLNFYAEHLFFNVNTPQDFDSAIRIYDKISG